MNPKCALFHFTNYGLNGEPERVLEWQNLFFCLGVVAQNGVYKRHFTSAWCMIFRLSFSLPFQFDFFSCVFPFVSFSFFPLLKYAFENNLYGPK